jgi:hypothetical protein
MVATALEASEIVEYNTENNTESPNQATWPPPGAS